MHNKLGGFRFFLRAVMALCVFYVIAYTADSHLRQMEKEQDYPAATSASQSIHDEIAEDSGENEPSNTVAVFEMNPAYWEYKKENTDLVGWLKIEDTIIHYPVMQSDDDEFYLNHNFSKEKDRHGCLFIRNHVNVLTPGSNFIIYGHNMKDGSMFGSLTEYRNRTFYEEHSAILFDNLYWQETYDILAVFESKVLEENEDGLRYYEVYQMKSEDDFNDFYQQIKNLSLYDTGVDASYGDRFLTLSTCSYHTDNGRFVIVAKYNKIS